MEASRVMLDLLGNHDLDEMIDLYEAVADAARDKAQAWRQIKEGLERLEAVGS